MELGIDHRHPTTSKCQAHCCTHIPNSFTQSLSFSLQLSPSLLSLLLWVLFLHFDLGVLLPSPTGNVVLWLLDLESIWLWVSALPLIRAVILACIYLFIHSYIHSSVFADHVLCARYSAEYWEYSWKWSILKLSEKLHLNSSFLICKIRTISMSQVYCKDTMAV